MTPADRALSHLENMLDGLAARPRMYGTTSEAVLFQALLALDVRAMLLGADDCASTYEATYEVLLNDRGWPSSLHASDHLDVDGVGG